MSVKDESDMFCEGTLPDDPEDDAEPFGEEKGKPVLDAYWRTLDGIDWTTPPPNRRWLLRHHQDGPGALPLGKAGVLAAGGGTGKTMALVQLALAVASGGWWLGTFKVVSPGDVLIALAEEDFEEVHRRFYRAMLAAKMGHEERAEVAKRITVLPLAGQPVALTEKDKNSNVINSPMLAELRERLSHGDWRLIVFDPLSRFAGDDAEKDNAAATRFVQAVESLVHSPGNPTVLVSHHSSATSVKNKDAGVRGVTAIVDGFRWAAALDALQGETCEGARLRLLKSNYTAHWDDVYLVRSTEQGTQGALLRANDEQQADLMKDETSEDAAAKEKNAEARLKNATTREKDAEVRVQREARLGKQKGKSKPEDWT